MSSLQKIGNVAMGLLMIACAILVFSFPKEGLLIFGWFISLALIVMGLQKLTQYLTMGRHMVGGKTLLLIGIFLIDFGVFAASLTDSPEIYLVIYLIAIYAFSGLVSLLRAHEAKKVGGLWKLEMAQGVVNLLVAVACVVFIGSPDTIALIFCIGLLWSALLRIISAFRQTDIVYVA